MTETENPSFTKKNSKFLPLGFSVHSTVSSKGQTVIPKEVREALGIKEGSELHWYVDGDRVIVRRFPDDPVAASIGAWKDNPVTTAALLEERRKDFEKEEAEAEERARRWRSTS